MATHAPADTEGKTPAFRKPPASGGSVSIKYTIKIPWAKVLRQASSGPQWERSRGTQAGLEGPRKAPQKDRNVVSILKCEGRTNVSQMKGAWDRGKSEKGGGKREQPPHVGSATSSASVHQARTFTLSPLWGHYAGCCHNSHGQVCAWT